MLLSGTNSERVILVQLHHEVASSVTRCPCCKPVVLVTLRGCHLLDGLVACDSVKARKEIMRYSGEEIVRGYGAHPAGIAKSNSSRARREGQQMVRPGQVLEIVISTPHGRV